MGAETSSRQPFAGTKPAGITGSWATVHRLLVKLQEADGRCSSEACLNMTFSNSFRKRKKMSWWRYLVVGKKIGDLMVVHQPHTFYKCIKKVVTWLKLTSPIHVYSCSLVLELYLTSSWNLTGMLLFNSFLIQNGSYPYILALFFFSSKNSDWNIFFLKFHWMKQRPVMWVSRVKEETIPRNIPTVFWPGLGRSSYCGFLFVLGKFPFLGDAVCRHFQKMLSAQPLQSCRRKGGGWGSVSGAQATFGKTVTA